MVDGHLYGSIPWIEWNEESSIPECHPISGFLWAYNAPKKKNVQVASKDHKVSLLLSRWSSEGLMLCHSLRSRFLQNLRFSLEHLVL